MTLPTTARELLAHVAEFAGEFFVRTGELAPMWHVVTEAGEHAVIFHPFGEDKNATMNAMRMLFAEKRVCACVFVSESWVLVERRGGEISKDEMEMISREGLEDHPDKREAVTYMAEDSVRVVTGMQMIERWPDGKVTLKELEVHDSDQAVIEGRMIGMLSRPATKH